MDNAMLEIENTSDSDVDSDGISQDCDQINAVIDADEQTSSTQISFCNYKNIPSTSGGPSTSTSTANKKLNKIEETLALNKLMDEKYQKLELLLTARLQECQEKLKTIGTAGYSRERKVNNAFRYYQCGRPYFKDKFNFSPPPNDDTILMQKSQMYDFSTLVTIPGWTVNDKTSFANVMLTVSQEIKSKEILEKINLLQRESSKTGKSNDDEINALSKQLLQIKMLPLEEIALPLDEEYDWEVIANKLSNRHVSQEYRAFWKLFFHPSINKGPWKKAEHKRLLEIASSHNYEDWDNIARILNTRRSGYQCFVYYRTNIATTHNGKKWTKEEVEYLKRVIEFYKEGNYIPWAKVASCMENRTKIQIYNKYIRMQEERKGRFFPEEDAVILNCYEKFGDDFKKISEFLPGRSANQIRIRCNLLHRKSVSVIWTVEDDKKLLQLMSNEDSATFYANATKHFPGKSRVHIRSRYTTLVNFMKKFPNWDIKLAPRRGHRRLPHGSPHESLNKALESLEKRMKSEINVKKSNRITKDSTEKEIEDAIVALLMTDVDEDENSDSQQESDEHGTQTTGVSKETDVNLRNILVLLNSHLNPRLFKQSSYSCQYPSLKEIPEKVNNVVKVKSYSKKNAFTTMTNNKPDIWGNNALGTLSYVLPPHYSTITGCKALMSVFGATNDNDINLSLWMRRNPVFKGQMFLLMERFYALFTWPMMLSNIEPNIQSVTAITEKVPKARKRHAAVDASSVAVAIPPVAKRYLKEEQKKCGASNKTIDLSKETHKEEITVSQDFEF